jgi:hypothetical protein
VGFFIASKTGWSMKKMPEKNPDLWTVVVAYFVQHSSFVCGVLVAFFASLSKSFLYGKKDTARRVIVEAFLCSLIAGSIRPVLTHFGLDIDLITPIGAAEQFLVWKNAGGRPLNGLLNRRKREKDMFNGLA